MASWEVCVRRFFAAAAAIICLVAPGMPAVASASFEVSAPTSIQYDPATGGFAVSGIQITGAPAYIQVGLTITDSTGQQVAATDDFNVAVATRCSFNNTWTNSSTGGQVVISGDNSTNVLLAGDAGDVIAAIDNVWIYDRHSNFCTGAATDKIGQGLLYRKLKVSAIETAPGIFWSPSTQHYYQLATQTTDDGMGQPTDDNGNITDSSRYFVKWSTARAEAKSTILNIGGNTHRGYLASITTRDEFSFLNDNVTAGSGILYPAWVGGSDAATEGIWKWVDGPEAEQFGGDSLTHYVAQSFTPDGRLLDHDIDGVYVNYPTDGNDYFSRPYPATFMRDAYGNKVYDSDSNYAIVLNPDPSGGYCADANNDNWAAWAAYQDGYPEVDITPWGSYVVCNMDLWNGYYPYVTPVIRDVLGNTYGKADAIYRLGDWGYNFTDGADGAGNYEALELGTSDFSQLSGSWENNYDGATFWSGQDPRIPNYDPPPDYCSYHGVRGICTITQLDKNGNNQTNNYFVYWSNGKNSIRANWDGTGVRGGDGVYYAQPDNAGNEDGLIINWCERNNGYYGDTIAKVQSLYGNPGYHCTPGWNDLPSGDWSSAHTTYSGPEYDTPNQIGTTDYVIEFCGYSDEAACATEPGTVASVAFSVTSQGCPQNANGNLSVSYSEANVQATDVVTPTMATETFNSVPAGSMPSQVTKVGYLTGTTLVGPAGVYGGAGGVGNYANPVNATLTLPTTECYVGFWWSAGNADNFVELLDSSNQVLATFSAGDLVTALGPCPNPYCGNPNTNYTNGGELYAYVHMRFPAGFQKVRFSGVGFEIDNISLSISLPSTGSGETFLGGADPALVTPDVILVDPRSHSVKLPEFQVSGTDTATLCIREVADSEGNALSNVTTTLTAPGAAGTVQTSGDSLLLSGTNTEVQGDTNRLRFSANHRLTQSGPTYLKVAAVSGSGGSADSCNSSVFKVVEVRPIELDLETNLVALFGNHH